MKQLMGGLMLKNFLGTFFKSNTEDDFRNEYLAEAVSLIDLENRLRQIDRGQAPWQLRAQQSLRGWQ